MGFVLALFISILPVVISRLEQGVFETNLVLNKSNYIQFQRGASQDTKIFAKISCQPYVKKNVGHSPTVSIDVVLRSSPCAREFLDQIGSAALPVGESAIKTLLYYFKTTPDDKDSKHFTAAYGYETFLHTFRSFPVSCDGEEHYLASSELEVNGNNSDVVGNALKTEHPLFVVKADAIYILIFKLTSENEEQFKIALSSEWKLRSSYLSPIDKPLLPFFGFMCGAYVVFAVLWLIWCFMHWRDILRVQYWIGVVIGIGLLEKMVFYIEYQKMNLTGYEAEGAVEFAEILSCLKKTVSAVLVIVVSVGYGVVKPRLGPTLQKVVGLGCIYFIVCSIEGVVRVSKIEHESVKQKQLIVLPLLLLYLAMFYWVFSSLVATTRALRLRRNEVKLALYRHFTWLLIFCVLSSACFMIWSLVTHRLNACPKDWKELWVDTAFWHLLFAILLFVIMFLWRPSINNQRYAFVPLLDNADDDDDEDTVFSEAFTTSEAIKLRTGMNNQQNFTKAENRKSKDKEASGLEDDLKWIEQNIPSTLADKALPAFMDSDEEREQVKFEVSKMQ